MNPTCPKSARIGNLAHVGVGLVIHWLRVRVPVGPPLSCFAGFLTGYGVTRRFFCVGELRVRGDPAIRSNGKGRWFAFCRAQPMEVKWYPFAHEGGAVLCVSESVWVHR